MKSGYDISKSGYDISKSGWNEKLYFLKLYIFLYEKWVWHFKKWVWHFTLRSKEYRVSSRACSFFWSLDATFWLPETPVRLENETVFGLIWWGFWNCEAERDPMGFGSMVLVWGNGTGRGDSEAFPSAIWWSLQLLQSVSAKKTKNPKILVLDTA